MRAAVAATQEIGLAVMATTLSLVVIFVPRCVSWRNPRTIPEEFWSDDGGFHSRVDAGQLHFDADVEFALVEEK
jgi:hypothetical protein